jgi:hypothetical protein
VLRRGPTYLDGVAPNAVNDRIYGETATVLMPTLTGDGPTFTISMHDDVVALAADISALQLHIEMAHWAPEDEVAVSLNGKTLDAPAIIDVAENDSAPPRVSENKWLVWDLKPDQIARGAHTIKVVLINRDDRISVPLTIEHVDVHVRYR